jgi:hypothetical protein
LDEAVRPFELIVKAGNSARPKTVTGAIVPQYLVALHHADDYDPSVDDEAMGRDNDVLDEEMIAAIVVRPDNNFPFHVDSLQRRSTILLIQQNTNRGEWTCASSAL